MTILITGGTGKTGLPLARIAHAANYPALVASRSGTAPEPFKGVKFDWFDATTYENPFKADPKIDRIYLVLPMTPEPLKYLKPFIELALAHGVKRFVLLTASQVEAGGPLHGAVHQYLIDLGVEYTVLRPTWFTENFGSLYAHFIKEYDQIANAAGNGLLPFISVEDIAQAAFDALTAEKSPNTDYLVVGPELFTYSDAMKILSAIVGREITYKTLSPAEVTTLLKERGLHEAYATALAAMEVKVSKGSEAEYFNASVDRKIVGKHTLKEYFEANKNIWIK